MDTIQASQAGGPHGFIQGFPNNPPGSSKETGVYKEDPGVLLLRNGHDGNTVTEPEASEYIVPSQKKGVSFRSGRQRYRGEGFYHSGSVFLERGYKQGGSFFTEK